MTSQKRLGLEDQILAIIHQSMEDRGFPPTYREVSVAVQSVHSNVWQAVQHLREGGFLRETAPPGTARSLVLSPAGHQRVHDSTTTPD